jgi:anti-sigma regulatory factor (Ser/Thr protein kinase)
MPARQHLRFRGTLAGYADAAVVLRQLLDAEQLNASTRYNVELAFEEIVTNIIRHGSPRADVDVAVAVEPEEVVLTFVDDGTLFDPSVPPDPALPASLDEARVGGLGLYMVRHLSSRMTYARTPEDHNSLTVAIPR